MSDRWKRKLAEEALMLSALGYLGEDGQVRCPECGSAVGRSDGWFGNFICSCGDWRLEDLSGA
jgi:hypothetical protein